ncbi:MAG TPA: Holliday junction branch migration protein RuvA [Candidatus Nanoarchaeia archaeon]|nr:Holliday junction branch migration protein RuvA [Candidatus Nanoarchaeia archaeon]
MIAYITGQATAVEDGRVVVETGGIGYEVYVPAADLRQIKVGAVVKFFVYEQLREDAHNLYGFGELSSKELFVNLLAVNGVGPKVALAILSAASAEQLRRAVISGDPELLRGVAGVGKKTAERIVIELRGKLAGIEGAIPTAVSVDSAYQALVGLGYPAAQAAEAIAKLPDDLTNDQDRIKAALKGISK